MSISSLGIRRPIAEVLIIVVGILLALAVDNWNDDRIERNLESQYLQRLLNEVSENADIVDRIVELSRRKIADLDAIDALVRQPRAARSMADLVIAMRSDALNYGWALPEFVDVVFGELRSTGRLGIVRDVELRSMLVDRYDEIANAVERIDSRRGGFAQYAYGLLPPEYFYAAEGDALEAVPELDDLTRDRLSAAVETTEFRQLLNMERNYGAFILQLMEQRLVPELRGLERALEQATSKT